MAVVKKSSSGRAIQFIDEDGNVFQLSAGLFGKVMSGGINGDFVVLTRMPIPVPVGRFPVSPIYGDAGVKSAVDNIGSKDAFSKSFINERKEQKVQKKVSEVKGNW